MRAALVEKPTYLMDRLAGRDGSAPKTVKQIILQFGKLNGFLHDTSPNDETPQDDLIITAVSNLLGAIYMDHTGLIKTGFIKENGTPGHHYIECAHTLVDILKLHPRRGNVSDAEILILRDELMNALSYYVSSAKSFTKFPNEPNYVTTR